MKKWSNLVFLTILSLGIACTNAEQQDNALAESTENATQTPVNPQETEAEELPTYDEFDENDAPQQAKPTTPAPTKTTAVRDVVDNSKPKTVTEQPSPAPEERSTQPEANEPEVAEPVAEPKPVENTSTTTTAVAENPSEENDVSHEAWNSLLQKYVNATGKVNYQGFKNDVSKLNTYLETLKKNPPQSAWSQNEKLAYWINSYNAFTVKLIVDNYPVKSITDLHGGKPWDVKWIKIGDKNYSLNNIEHDIIRPQFKEPRIHFAVNCAAQSCPPLLNEAYMSDKLDSQLTKQAESFINNPKFNKINAKQVEISKIFEWYKEDFGNITNYLNKYSTTKINDNASVKHLEYNWALNG